MSMISLSSPWVTFYRRLNAMFKEDPTVNVIYDEAENEIRIYCNYDSVANALAYLLPSEKDFGNVTLKITVVPANKDNVGLSVSLPSSLSDVYRNAFYCNDAVSDIIDIHGVTTNPITYIIFNPVVVQYWTDDLSDAHGLCSTLYQNIARDVFEKQDGIFFCTDAVK